MKSFKFCTNGNIFRDIPCLCICLQIALAAVLTVGLGYLFISDFLLK